jgi:hypothetical protein
MSGGLYRGGGRRDRGKDPVEKIYHREHGGHREEREEFLATDEKSDGHR